ncbi:MAG: acyl-CoA thioesterase [Desulfobacteraceae bacterium]|jgi:thioesterase-3
MIHSIEIKIRGYHLDLFGHVNNARYLEFLEEARWAAFEKTVDLEALARQGHAFTVVKININYRRPALMNDRLVVETHISKWSRRSAVVRQEVKNKVTGEIVVDADVTFVMFDTRKKKTARLEGPLLEMLQSV